MVSENDEILLISLIIFFVSFSGVIFNIFAMVTVLKSPVLRNAFGALCFSHTIANFGVLFVFLIWVTPTTYWQYMNTDGTVGKLLGQINILFWNACCYSHLAISINRLISISMPTKINILFSARNTSLFISIVWCMAIFHILPYFWRATCYMVYDPVSWTWMFANTPCGSFISQWTDYFTSVVIFVVMSTLDFLTLCLLVSYNKNAVIGSVDQNRKRRRTEIRFFIQSVCQGLLFFFEIFNFYYIVTLDTNQWFIFITSTFAWELCHCLDGLVVIIFHFRRSFIQRGSSVQNTKVFSVHSDAMFRKQSTKSLL